MLAPNLAATTFKFNVQAVACGNVKYIHINSTALCLGMCGPNRSPQCTGMQLTYFSFGRASEEQEGISYEETAEQKQD